MTSNDAGAPTDSQNAADDEGIKAADTNAEPQEEDRTTPPAEQVKTKSRRLTRKVRTVITQQPKRRLGALTATVTATAGLVAGWAIRRGRRRKPHWPRRLR